MISPSPVPIPGLVDSIDAIGTSGYVPMHCPSSNGCAVNVTPFYYGSLLYMVMQKISSGGGGPYPISVFKWNPATQIWSVMNATFQAVRGDGTESGGVFYDAAGGVVYVAYNPGTIGAGGALTIARFLLASETWGSLFPIDPTINTMNQIVLRSDGSFLMFHNRAKVGASIVGLSATSLKGGVFTTFDIDTGLPGGATSNAGSSIVYDPATGVTHVFGVANTGGGNIVFYQAVNLDGSLGQYSQFDATNFYVNDLASGNPVIVNGKIMLGVVDKTQTFPALLIGTPLNAPVFTVSSNIDPFGPVIDKNFGGGHAPSLAYNPATNVLAATWVPGNTAIRFLFSRPPSMTWTASDLGNASVIANGIDFDATGFQEIGFSNGVLFSAFEIFPQEVGPPNNTQSTFAYRIDLPNLDTSLVSFGGAIGLGASSPGPIALPDPRLVCAVGHGVRFWGRKSNVYRSL